MLLQQHGYFVLRFLAEDVGKHLDAVLDAILRALAHREVDRVLVSVDRVGGLGVHEQPVTQAR